MIEQIKGLNFYEIRIVKDLGLSSYDFRMCSYRSFEEVKSVFTKHKAQGIVNKFSVVPISHEWIAEDETYWFPVFFVELNNVYTNLAGLVEDTMVAKLSGALEVDVYRLLEKIGDISE